MHNCAGILLILIIFVRLQLANLALPEGEGDKLVLRLLAHRLGMRIGATAPKRAIQFGSRIAKREMSACGILDMTRSQRRGAGSRVFMLGAASANMK